MLRMANAAVGLVLLLLVGVLPARAPIAGTPVTYADRLAAYQAVYPPVHTCYQKLKRGADAWAECKRGWASSKAAANSSFFILFMDCWPLLQAAAEALQRVPAAKRTGGSQAVKAETELAADNLDKANKCIMEGNELATRLLQEAQSGAPAQTAGQGPISGGTQKEERPVLAPPGEAQEPVMLYRFKFTYGPKTVWITRKSTDLPGSRITGSPDDPTFFDDASALVVKNRDGSIGVVLEWIHPIGYDNNIDLKVPMTPVR